MRIAFLACVESGVLEAQALLLFRSIRTHAGKYSDSTLVAFQPRKGRPLAAETVREFAILGVEFRDEILNTDFADYPIGNKIFAAARAEEILDHDILVFADSDTLFAREPKELALPRRFDAAVRPVDTKKVGSTGPGDRRDEYWLRLYQICGVPEAPFVETTVDRQRIRAYWNAGLIAVRRSAGLFASWRDDFLKLMHAGHVPSSGTLTHMDQLALAATLARSAKRIRTLSYRYNYPLPMRADMVSSARRAPLEKLVHIHYHRTLARYGYLKRVEPPFRPNTPIYRWISQQLPVIPKCSQVENRSAPTSSSRCRGFFVVGTGRSGTTMFRNLLRFHPHVYLPRETHWIPFLYHTYGTRRVPHDEFFRVMNSFYMARGTTALERILREIELDPDEFESELRSRLSPDGADTIADFHSRFYAILAERHGATIWGDKTPDYGLCMGLLQSLWPEARFIHLARDGRDVALSMSRVMSFRLQVLWEVNHWWSIAWEKAYRGRLEQVDQEIPIEKFFELWKSRTQRTRDESRRLRDGTYLEIEYDALLKDPRGTLRQVGDFLQLPGGHDWILDAVKLVDRSNIGRNRHLPEHRLLTERYSDDLRQMGFEP